MLEVVRQSLLAVALIVLSTIAALPAEGAFEILPEQGVFYFTNKLVSDGLTTGPAGPKVFEATDVAPTSETSQKAYTTVSAVAASFETEFRWTATEAFSIDGEVTATFWLSCDAAAVYTGPAVNSYRLTMKKNGATVGTSKSLADAAPQACTGPSSIRELSLTLSLPETKWKAGETIGASFAVWAEQPPETAAKNVHFLVGSTKHPSHLRAVGLPNAAGAAPAAAAVNVSYANETLNGTSAEIQESFANATSGAHNYTWTTDASNVTVDVEASALNGSLELEIRDGAGEQVYLANFTGGNETNQSEPAFLAGAAGNWTIQIRLTEFVGAVNVTLAPAPVVVESTNETLAPSNETAAPKDEEGGGAPGLPVVAVVVALAAIVAIRRRRN